MNVPSIDRQVRRNVGAAAEATDFGSVQWVVREGDPPGTELTIGLATFGAGKSNVQHIHPTVKKSSTSSTARWSTRLAASPRRSAPAT